MLLVIYDKRTSAIIEHPRTRTRSYKTSRSAQSALTKMINSGRIIDNTETDNDGRCDSWYSIAEYRHYQKHIEQFIEVTNLMSGKLVKQSINTPLSCDVSSETYWSM